MATLFLIRHGQASFGQKNYDRLSDIGHQQAHMLGESLKPLDLTFDALYAGEMQRQQDTAKPYLRDNANAPALSVDAAFNEYDSEGVFRTYLPHVYKARPDLGVRHADLFTDKAMFKTCFNEVLRLWLNDPRTPDGLESWDAFGERVCEGLNRVADHIGRDGTAAIFTSGGPICIAIGAALGLDKDAIIQQTWLTRNASINELHWGGSQPRLLGYNNVTHLLQANDAQLITMR